VYFIRAIDSGSIGTPKNVIVKFVPNYLSESDPKKVVQLQPQWGSAIRVMWIVGAGNASFNCAANGQVFR